MVTMVNTNRRGVELWYLVIVTGRVITVKMGQYILEQLGKQELKWWGIQDDVKPHAGLTNETPFCS